MGYALLAYTVNAIIAAGNNNYSLFGNVGGTNYEATEANSQFKAKVAGTLDLLQATVDAVGTGRSIRFRKNTANGNQVVSPTDTTAGTYTDNTNSDAIASGDLINLLYQSTGTPTYNTVRMRFKATTDHACYYTAAKNTTSQTPTDSTTYYFKCFGRSPTLTTIEANAKTMARVAGTLQNAQLFLQTNARMQDSTYRSRIDTGGGSANGNIVVTVTASTTGLFEDNSHTDAIASGDRWNFALTSGTGGGAQIIENLTCAIGGISTPINDLFCGSTAGVARAASGTASFSSITGRLGMNATEAVTKVQHGFPTHTTRFRLFLSASTYSVDGVAVVRKNGADGAQTFPLTALTTGLFEDTTHADDFISTDDINFSINGGTTGSITAEWAGITEYDSSPVSVALAGVSGTGSVGSLGVTHKNPLTGIAGTGSLGTLSPIQRKALTGISATGSVGTLGVLHKNALTGISGTGSLGTLTPVNGKAVAITGVSGTGSLGILGVVHRNALTGILAIGQLGTLTPVISGGAVSVALTGIQARGFLGILSPIGGVQPGGYFIPLTEKQLREHKKRERRDAQLQRDLDHSRKLDANAIEIDIRSQMFPAGLGTIIEQETVVENEGSEDEDLELLLLNA